MQLTVTFNSIDELMEFTNCFKEPGTPTTLEAHAVPSASVAPAVPEAPVTPVVPDAPQAPVAYTVPSVPVKPTEPTTQMVPTSSKEYTLDEISVAAMQLMDAGRQADLQQLLTKFGVPSLPALPKAQYGAFATQLRAMGARI